MAYDYSKIANTAKRLIDKFGRTITKRTVTSGGTEWNPTQTEVDTNIIGVFTSFSKMEIDGKLIQVNDKKILTYDEVILTDIIVDNGIEYTVMNVDVIQPADLKLIYKVQVRK